MADPDPTTARRAKAAAQRARQRKAAVRRRLLLVGGAVLAVLAVLGAVVVVGVHARANRDAVTAGSADAAVLAKLTVPAAALDKAGVTGVGAAPTPLANAPALTADGKPQVLYVGANWCPFCAAERWSLIVALSRFGTFHNLATSASSPIDTYPDTPTFSFHGATYTSQYLAFTGVEQQTNQPKNGGYPTLDTLTPAQQKVFSTYDAPPYLASKGSIPFVDFGGKYVMQGAGYSPQLLAGKTQAQIAATLADPKSQLGQTIDGNANVLTAALCTLTDNKPGGVCTDPVIAKIRGQLDAQPKR